MARPRKLSPALIHTYTNLDIRHIAYAASHFAVTGDLKAIKSTSVLIRTIVEEWIQIKGGNKIESLDRAYEILGKLGIAPERSNRVKDRGNVGKDYEDEEAMDDREEREIELDNFKVIEPEEYDKQKAILIKALNAERWLKRATDADLKKDNSA